ncbi:MAG: prepilin peptidase [Alphaproteobacteria bacterium]|nr:prepilin peptidase [Alphaproteobacteria bacterium]
MSSLTVHVQAIILTGFAGLMAVAAFEDFRRLIIPNLLTIALCGLWPFYVATTAPSLEGIAAALGCAVIVFVAGALLFARGLLGGGDVKLLSAAVLWAGPAATPKLLMLTCVLGGVLALFMLIPVGRQLAAAGRMLLGQPPMMNERGLSISVPYGIAIAGAAIFVMFPSAPV